MVEEVYRRVVVRKRMKRRKRLCQRTVGRSTPTMTQGDPDVGMLLIGGYPRLIVRLEFFCFGILGRFAQSEKSENSAVFLLQS